MTDNLPPTTFSSPQANQPVSPPPITPPPETPPVPPAEIDPTAAIGSVEQKPRKKKVMVATLSLFLVVASTAAAVYLAGQRQETRKEAVDCNPTCIASAISHGYESWCEGSCRCIKERDTTKGEDYIHFLDTPWCEGNDQFKCLGSAKTPDDTGSLKCGTASDYRVETHNAGNCVYLKNSGSKEVFLKWYSCICSGTAGGNFCNEQSADLICCSQACADKGYGSREGDLGSLASGNEKESCASPPICTSEQIDLDAYKTTAIWDSAQHIGGGGVTSASSTQLPNPACSPSALSCSSLTSSPDATTRKLNDSINLTCAGAGQGLNHFEFQKTIGTGTPVALPSVAASGTTGQINYKITEYGCYKIECRACTSADNSACTAWGKAN